MALRDTPCATASALKRASHASKVPLGPLVRQSVAQAAVAASRPAARTGAAQRRLRSFRFMFAPAGTVGIGIFLSHMQGSIVAVQPCIGEAYGKVLQASALLSYASL